MKHVFDCGITAESHDGLGDQFLIQMETVEAERRKRETDKHYIASLMSELQTARQWFAALCHEHGGEIFISQRSVMLAGFNPDLRVTVDHLCHGYRITVTPVAGQSPQSDSTPPAEEAS